MTDTGVLIRQLQGALGGRRRVGPFTAASGALAPGTAVTGVVVTHNLGTTDYYVDVAERIDSTWGADVSWAVTAKGANTVTFYFQHLGTHNPAALTLNFFLAVALG